MKVVVVLSGGLDSTVLLASALEQGFEVRAITFDYGQRHNREIQSAIRVAHHFGLDPGNTHKLIDISHVGEQLLQGSALTSPSVEVPLGHYADPSMRITVVPNRNMIMLSIAAGWAISLSCGAVALGVHAGDHAVYPDCRPRFFAAAEEALRLGNYVSLTVMTPFIDWTKAAIVKHGAELKAPFELSWSCYQGGEKHCGKCGTCVERREAFQLAGVPDPTEYFV